VSLAAYLSKQFIDVIEWNEPADGILSYRYPMHDLEIQVGGHLTVRESQTAVFVNDGKVADIFGPGQHTLSTPNMPILTEMLNLDENFDSPFRSDVYFFSTRQQLDQKWGTATPITIRDNEFGAVHFRCFGIYSYRVADPHAFFNQVSGTRGVYFAEDLEGQLRNMILAHIADVFADSKVAFLDLAANQTRLAAKISEGLKPLFAELGLSLTQFVVDNVSMPEELAKVLDQRIGMKIVGGTDRYARHTATESFDHAAAGTNVAGRGMSVVAGAAVAQMLSSKTRTPVVGTLIPTPVAVATAPSSKFCRECGQSIPARGKFCAECGMPQ
jgi:membrane protease subunit (stomatin/prohibitin family)